MASMCLSISSMVFSKNSQIKSSDLRIRKPLYSSRSTSMPVTTVEQPVVRRSGNYDPTLWSYDHVQSLSSKYVGEHYVARADTLKDVVKKMIREDRNVLSTLKLVDDLQRLGIAYHFEEEIGDVLETIYETFYITPDKWEGMDLNVKALGFRLLRQHGYQVPQEIFRDFKNKTQNLKPYILQDMVSVLNLYEASYHSFEDESILDEANEFTTKYLKENLENINEGVSALVSHSLDIPLHWRVPRVEAKWFIHHYENRGDRDLTLVELSKLDFDMLQAVYIEDLKHTSRWWNNIRWGEKLSFTRDRVVEHFLWALGFEYLPQFSHGRRTLARINCMLTTLDDVYDLYGTLDELEQLANAVERWDINAINDLPDYMKICFLGYYNTINEITYNTLTERGFFVLPYLKNTWMELFKTWLLEAKWYHNGYTPTLQEYLDNASVSIGGWVLLMHVRCLLSFSSIEEILQCMERTKNLIRYSSIVFRLADDLGTSSEEMARGDISKSIQCYMYESGATEEEARMHIKSLMMETWKKVNKELACMDSQIPREFINCVTNIPRMSQFMYNEGDGHGHPAITKSHVSSLLFNPIQEIK
ncbi:terpenoid cyclases/protein prenyltransferase alpha-alpha toroid [Artemisia annua]|uniref:Terpenoid cyclases/protein prenyltransferase alpha-alpha toroid n=1 Tax=Artemisia annua TaxID=35608 RepID=A0A2U1N7Z8_ARTAN|nr:terpenoid cyclases/protein prenyltransferase alpha-alpha toroid [Artemisia annua]